MNTELPPTEPILLRPDQAASVLSISRSHFDALNASGLIGPKPIRLGKLRLWPRNELERWAAAGAPGRVEWLRQLND